MVQIRNATPDDRAFILGLTPRFAEFELPPWRSRATIVGGTAEQLRRALESADDRSAVLLAVAPDGAPLGFAWTVLVPDFYTGEPVGKISEIAVLRSGQGVGRALMAACEAWAFERGARLMMLNVLEGNVRAQAFYREMGYRPEYSALAKRLR